MPEECAKCKAPAGRFITRLRLKPLDHTQMIVLGALDPGPDWWDAVNRFWDVSDAPLLSSWVPPVCVRLEEGECQFCRGEKKRAVTPSLFDTKEDAA